jgi:hypothetical protein
MQMYHNGHRQYHHPQSMHAGLSLSLRLALSVCLVVPPFARWACAATHHPKPACPASCRNVDWMAGLGSFVTQSPLASHGRLCAAAIAFIYRLDERIRTAPAQAPGTEHIAAPSAYIRPCVVVRVPSSRQSCRPRPPSPSYLSTSASTRQLAAPLAGRRASQAGVPRSSNSGFVLTSGGTGTSSKGVGM